MTDRMTRPVPYGGYIGEPKPGTAATDTASTGGNELSPKKTLFVLVVVVGCFAILWPKLFYPMLVANANNQMKPNSFDKGCCDVIHLKDVDAIRIMSELCKDIITQQGSPTDSLDPKKMVDYCRKEVLETCGIDISAALQERVALGHSVKQILDEIRSLNGSTCLKYNFGVSPSRLGVPHIRVTLNLTNNIRQERPPHLRPEIMHPAFRERGKAIPHPELSVTKRPSSQPPPRIVEGRPGPIPGMRPGLGGPGHVVQKQQGNGIMGFLMPVYTIGFVIFFTYTLMKIAFKKKPEIYGDDYLYPQVDPDENFREEVFEPSSKHYTQQQQQKMNGKNETKIVVNAVAALLEEVDQEIHSRSTPASHDVGKETLNEQDEVRPNGSALKEETQTKEHLEEIEETVDEDQPRVAVMGMETTASSEDGKRWSRPDSPTLPHPSRVETLRSEMPKPQEIFLEGTLPPDSQILVSDSATATEKNEEDDSSVVLAGKMTLSVISLDSENDTAKSPDEERKSSSGNTSEDFEKIYAHQLEEQIDEMIEKAENVVDTDDSLELELKKTEETKQNEVLAEIQRQFNLEDDLLEALTVEEAKLESLPVTDIIKEFLAEEEICLSQETVFEQRQPKVQFGGITEQIDTQNVNEENLREETYPEYATFNKLEAANLAEQIINDIEDELSNTNVEEIEELLAEQIINDIDEEPSNTGVEHQPSDSLNFEDNETIDYNRERTPSKSEERFIQHQYSSEELSNTRVEQNEAVMNETIEQPSKSLTFEDNEAIDSSREKTPSKSEERIIPHQDSSEELAKTRVEQTEDVLDKTIDQTGERLNFEDNDSSRERTPSKSEERFIPHQDSSEDRADRRKKRQDRLKRDLEALTSSVEEAMGSKLDSQSPTTSFDESDNNLDETELSHEEMEILKRYQSEDSQAQPDQKREADQGSEKSFDSTDTVKENSDLKDNEYLFGSKQQRSLLEALELSTSAQGEASSLGDVKTKAAILAVEEDPIVDVVEDIEYISEYEENSESEEENVQYGNEAQENEKSNEESDMENEERSVGRTSPGGDLRIVGEFSENKTEALNGSETNAENEISDEDEIENEEDSGEEMEEIIEYVDNTDEEGEEIIEIEEEEIRNGHH